MDSSHSFSENCENDNCVNLDNFKQFLLTNTQVDKLKPAFTPQSYQNTSVHFDKNCKSPNTESKLILSKVCQSHVTGVIKKSVKKRMSEKQTLSNYCA